MSLSAYSKTTWVNGGTPAINQTNLNKIETGIDDVTEDVLTASTIGDTTVTQEVTSLASTVLEAPFSTAYLRGRTVANMLGTAGDFEATTGWSGTNATIATDTNHEIFTSNALKITLTDVAGTVDFDVFSRLKTGSYYFLSAYIKNGNATNINLEFETDDADVVTADVTATTYNRVGLVVQPSDFNTASTALFRFNVTGAGTQYAYVEGAMMVEITSAEYALGATALLAKYPYHSDIKGSDKMRVLSVGKNLFDKDYFADLIEQIATTNVSRTILDGRDVLSVVGGIEGNLPYTFLSNTQYTLQCDIKRSSSVGGILIFYYTDGTESYLGLTCTTNWVNYTAVSTAGKTILYIRLIFADSGTTYYDLDTLQLERNSAATTYEPYKSTSAIVDTVGNSVSDTIYDKVDLLTGRKEQNVSALTEISGTVYDSYDGATYTNVDVVKTTAFSSMIAQTTSADGTTRYFDKNNKELEEVAQADIDLIASIGKYYTHTDKTVWIILADGAYANIGDARTGLGTSNILYQLAEPIITNGYPNVLESYPSGTIMVLPQIEDKGIYGTNLAITDTDLPISSLVEVWKVNTDDTKTPIAISDCTVAAGGLTYEISGASAGEYYKYIYNYVGLSSQPSLTYDTADSTKAVEDNLCTAVALLDEKIEDVETAIDADIAGIRTKLERYGASSGGSDTYAVTNTYPTKALYTGMFQEWTADVANTGASTLNVDGLGAKANKVYDSSGKTDTATGDIIAGGKYISIYDGTDMILLNPNALRLSVVTAQGDMLYASGANTLTRLAKGTAYQVLSMNSGATAPEWKVESMTKIATLTGGGASYEFSSIPNTYKALKVLLIGEGTGATASILVTINSDSTNDYYSAATGAAQSNSTSWDVGTMSTAGVGAFGTTEINFPFYADTNYYHSFYSFNMYETTGARAYNTRGGTKVSITNAISTITIALSSGNFDSNAIAILYGIY